jgi:hypothetical protein
MYIGRSVSREKGARPVLITPVSQNKWEKGQIQNSHAAYYQAVVDLSREMVENYLPSHYFMNLPAGRYKSNPDGLKDNPHFQTEGRKS